MTLAHEVTADGSKHDSVEATKVPTTARQLLAPAGSAYLGALLSIALIAAGVVGIRDGVLAAGCITGSSWTGAAVDWLDGLTSVAWMTPAGIAAALVGLVAVVLAIKPRRKTSVEISGRSSVVITHADVARAAGAAARAVPGVVEARATSAGNKLTINAKTTTGRAGEDAVKAAVTSAVSHTLEMLSSPPRIVVRTRSAGGPE